MKQSRKLFGFACTIYGLMFLTMMPTLSFSAEWSVAPSIAIKGYYNSNLLLTPLPHEATYGYWISPKAEFATRTENLEVSGQTALDFVDYYGGRQTQFTNVSFLCPCVIQTRQISFLSMEG